MEDTATQEAFREAVKDKWRHALKRMNGNEAGITGLMTFTGVRSYPSIHLAQF